MTIKDLLIGQPTLRQFGILQWADVEFRDRAGRYFGGQLTQEQHNSLVKELK